MEMAMALGANDTTTREQNQRSNENLYRKCLVNNKMTAQISVLQSKDDQNNESIKKNYLSFQRAKRCWGNAKMKNGMHHIACTALMHMLSLISDFFVCFKSLAHFFLCVLDVVVSFIVTSITVNSLGPFINHTPKHTGRYGTSENA